MHKWSKPQWRMGWFLRGAVLVLMTSTFPAWAQQKYTDIPHPQKPAPCYSDCAPGDPTPTPPSPSPDHGYSQVTVQQGVNWRLVQVSGYAVDGDGRYFNEPMYMLQDAQGISNAPLPAGVKDDLLNAVDSTSTSFVLSQHIVNEINTSEKQGWLTPDLQAIAEPLDGMEQPSTSPSHLRIFGRCDDRTTNMSKSFNISAPLNKSFGGDASFNGSMSLSGDAQASATGEVQIHLKRYRILGVCIPYSVKFDFARAYGTAQVNYSSTLSGRLNYSNHWEWPLSKPFLFGFAFALGPIPVYVGFNLPITAGLDLDANATGSVTYNGAQSLSGHFDYYCTLDNCSGSTNFNTTGLQSPQSLAGSVSGRVQPTVWAQVAFRGYLYDDSVAYAQLGIRPKLYGDLWGYYGNTCGDADADGISETVDALTFDLDWQIYVTAQADSFLSKERRWNLWNTARWHINYWDLLRSGSRVLQPMLNGAPSITVSTTQSYGAQMRPCWPYTDTVKYQLNWGDGSSPISLSGAPATSALASHAWSSTGVKGLVLVAQQDAHGRLFNKSTTRNIQVNPAGGNASHLGLSWQVRQQNGSYTLVGNEGQSNAYNGDTSPYTAMPLLCLKKDGRAAPSAISFDFYHGWAAGEIRLTQPIYGTSLTSKAAGDSLCANMLGAGFRMAEFHDGGGGWNWWAQGVISSTSRFWVAVNDQPANPWN